MNIETVNLFRPVTLPKIAALGLSLELYRDLPGYCPKLEALWREELSELATVAEIKKSLFTTSEVEIRNFCTQAEDMHLDALVVSALSYAASGISLDTLLKTSLPIVIWNTQYAKTIEEDYTFDDLLMNHTVQGIQDLTNCLTQNGKDFFIATGHYQDIETLNKISDFLVAAQQYRRKDKIRVLEIGGMFPGMEDFKFDAGAASGILNYEFVTVAPEEFRRICDQSALPPAVEALRATLGNFSFDSSLNAEILRRSLVMECGLRKLLADYRTDAFTMNFAALVESKLFDALPFLAINRLMGEGMGYAGEGDILRAALMAEMRLLTGSANFTEIYTIDFVRNRMLMCHMQECNMSWARQDRPITLLRKEFWAPGMEDYAGMHFTVEPGTVTLLTITPQDGQNFGCVAFVAEVVDQAPLARFNIPHWLVESRGKVGELLDRYSEAGGCHHLIAVRGDRRRAIENLCCLRKMGYKDITL